MLRYENLKDFTDGRTYGLNDMARIGTRGCKGCSLCCESNMGNTIVLDPRDIRDMTKATGKTFDELLTAFIIELSMVDGIVLPNLKMDQGCRFLQEGRCRIHDARPGICRLFPLGRLYRGDEFVYIRQTGVCPVKDPEKVKVQKWLGYPDPEKHAAFVRKWHKFLSMERKKVKDAGSRFQNRQQDDVTYDPQEVMKRIMKTVLQWFYLDPYSDGDFYQEFDERMRGCLSELRKI